MSRIECFLIEPTDTEHRSLRRYAADIADSKCPGPMGYHDAKTDLEDGLVKWNIHPDNSKTYGHSHLQQPPHDDSRWPRVCACGYEFKESDNWQLFGELIYARKDTGEQMTLRSAKPGAIWDAFWFPKSWDRGPDGLSLIVMTPGGEWHMDGPAKGGGRWTRSGMAPKLTATPSILIEGKYHGWLTDGFLVDC